MRSFLASAPMDRAVVFPWETAKGDNPIPVQA